MFLVTLAVLAAVLFFRFRIRRRRLYQLAKRIPGQNELPLIGHLNDFAGDTEDIMKTLTTISYEAIRNGSVAKDWLAHKLYFDIMKTLTSISYEAMRNGSVAKVWLAHKLYFVMVDPVDIEFVLKTCLEKDDLHKFFREVLGNGLVFAPLRIWRERRKVIVPAFSPKIVDSFVDILSEQSAILAGQMRTRVGNGTFDLWPFISTYTFDSISEAVMGKEQSLRRPPLLLIMNSLLNVMTKRIFHVWLQSNVIFRNMPGYKTYEKNLNTIHDFTDSVIECKREEIEKNNKTFFNGDKESDEKTTESQKDERKTFLDLLIENSSKNRGYSDVELREEMLTLMVAGSDSTAVATSFTLLLLGKHQDIQDKVYNELLDVYGDSDNAISKENLRKLVYLERVIKESLRLYPPAPFVIRKVVNEITLRLVLPAGCGISVSIWGAHRNQRYWGEDAETFDPDRFSPERYNLAHPCAYIPFSSGPRNCLGHQFGMNSMKMSISSIVRKFRVMVPEESVKAKIRIKIDVMIKAVGGFQVALEKRSFL